jgi:hypothetical protein
VLGKVIGRHESKDVVSQCVGIGAIECPNRGLFDGSVNLLRLAVGPRMIWPGGAVLDAELRTHAIEDVRTEIPPGWAGAVLWQVGEGHTVIGEHRVDGVRKGADNAAQELGTVHLPSIVAELDVGKLRDAVYGEEHVELSAAEAELTDIDMDVSDFGVCELALLGGGVLGVWQARDTMTQQTAMQARRCGRIGES